MIVSSLGSEPHISEYIYLSCLLIRLAFVSRAKEQQIMKSDRYKDKFRTLHKYKLPDKLNNISMPVGARILDCQMQNGTLFLWAMIDSNAEQHTRTFKIFSTGEDLQHPIGPEHHVATVQDTESVLHVFEIDH